MSEKSAVRGSGVELPGFGSCPATCHVPLTRGGHSEPQVQCQGTEAGEMMLALPALVSWRRCDTDHKLGG